MMRRKRRGGGEKATLSNISVFLCCIFTRAIYGSGHTDCYPSGTDKYLVVIALEERDDIDSLNKNMTEMIQQSAMRTAKQTKKQKKPKISSPTRALIKKRREMIENNTPRDHIEYVEICKTIKKKVRGDISSLHIGCWYSVHLVIAYGTAVSQCERFT